MSKEMWGEAILTITYLVNRYSTASLDNKTPVELWYGFKPSVAHLRIFDCNAYYHIPKEIC